VKRPLSKLRKQCLWRCAAPQVPWLACESGNGRLNNRVSSVLFLYFAFLPRGSGLHTFSSIMCIVWLAAVLCGAACEKYPHNINEWNCVY